MSKGAVTQFLESKPPTHELVAGLLKWGYSRFQIAEMTDLSLKQVHKVMRDNKLSEL